MLHTVPLTIPFPRKRKQILSFIKEQGLLEGQPALPQGLSGSLPTPSHTQIFWKAVPHTHLPYCHADKGLHWLFKEAEVCGRRKQQHLTPRHRHTEQNSKLKPQPGWSPNSNFHISGPDDLRHLSKKPKMQTRTSFWIHARGKLSWQQLWAPGFSSQRTEARCGLAAATWLGHAALVGWASDCYCL